jgi:hypothetical protein
MVGSDEPGMRDMKWGLRRTIAGLVALGVIVLALVIYFGTHRYDDELEVLDRRERCVAMSQSIRPDGADDGEKAQLARCRSEGWAPGAEP